MLAFRTSNDGQALAIIEYAALFFDMCVMIR